MVLKLKRGEGGIGWLKSNVVFMIVFVMDGNIDSVRFNYFFI